MTFSRLMLVAACCSLSACTGAKVISGSSNVKDARVGFWTCSDDGVLHLFLGKTDADGVVVFNPLGENTNDFDHEKFVPPGVVLVTVNGRQRQLTHVFDRTCPLAVNGTLSQEQCSADVFNLSARTDVYNEENNVMIWAMKDTFTWWFLPGQYQNSGDTNLAFPASWPSSCKSDLEAASLMHRALYN